jgi:hypothetical protein
MKKILGFILAFFVIVIINVLYKDSPTAAIAAVAGVLAYKDFTGE